MPFIIRIDTPDPQSELLRPLFVGMVAEIPPRYGEHLDTAAQAERVERLLATQSTFLAPRSIFLVAYCDGELAGCGALLPLDENTAEIRRIYALQEMRRRGVAQALLQALEEQARHFGYARVCLETGNRQPEAVALYAAAGYLPCEPFGPNTEDPTNVYFEKRLPA